MFRVISFGVVIRWQTLSWSEAAKCSTSKAKWPDVACGRLFPIDFTSGTCTVPIKQPRGKHWSAAWCPCGLWSCLLWRSGSNLAGNKDLHKPIVLSPTPTKESTSILWHALLCSHQCNLQVFPGSFKFLHAPLDWCLPIHTIQAQTTALGEVLCTVHPCAKQDANVLTPVLEG